MQCDVTVRALDGSWERRCALQLKHKGDHDPNGPMPDSKLVEKLGFHIEGEVLTWPDGDRRYALATERAAWKLCLELSERLDLIVECVRDKELSDGAKLQAIGILVTPKREPTEKEIAYAKTLDPERKDA